MRLLALPSRGVWFQRLPGGDQSQHLGALFRDGYRVFSMRAGLAVHRHHRPSICQDLRKMRALVDHRLDCEDVAALDLRPQPRPAIVRDLRIFVHPAPDAVAHVVANNRIAVRFRMLLNCPPDIAEMVPGATFLDRTLETFLCNANQSALFFIDLADGNRSRRISNKAFERYAAVDRKNVAFLQGILRRKSVNYLFVDRSADGIRKTVVTFERRQSTGVADHLFRFAIDFERRDTRLRKLA